MAVLDCLFISFGTRKARLLTLPLSCPGGVNYVCCSLACGLCLVWRSDIFAIPALKRSMLTRRSFFVFGTRPPKDALGGGTITGKCYWLYVC